MYLERNSLVTVFGLSLEARRSSPPHDVTLSTPAAASTIQHPHMIAAIVAL
jgi:hypothetical protein